MTHNQELSQLTISKDEEYAAISSNLHNNILDFCHPFLLFSRCHCPVLYNTLTNKVTTILKGHTNEVNGCKFIEDRSEIDAKSFLASCHSQIKTYHLLSYSHDKSIIIWQLNTDMEQSIVKSQKVFKLYSEEGFFLTASSVLVDFENQVIFLTIAVTISGQLYIWNNDKLLSKTSMNICSFDCRLHTEKVVQNGKLVYLAFLAGSDNNIHVLQIANLHPLYSGHFIINMMKLLGHSGWVKSIDLIEIGSPSPKLYLASASQDGFSRVWLLKFLSKEIDEKYDMSTISKPIFFEQDSSRPNDQVKLSATLDTVLDGSSPKHGIKLFKKNDQTIQLVCCSDDKTISMYSYSLPYESEPGSFNKSPATNQAIWKKCCEFGERGEYNLPFISIALPCDGKILFATSLKGALHMWLEVEDNKWKAKHLLTGHFGPVTDISWNKSGDYFLTVSSDKTCRLHAKTKFNNQWHEIARPQVHGYAINCVCSLSFNQFISGAEEKTLRSFKATKFFHGNYRSLVSSDSNNEACLEDTSLPKHAQLPALGLSAKATNNLYNSGDNKDVSDIVENWNSISELYQHIDKVDYLNELPIEEVLLLSTLWYESKKLFGHGNEVYALAVDPDCQFIASSCKSTKKEFSNIIIWNASNFKKRVNLFHHSLTITRLRFSPCGLFLLSVSRDRSWGLYRRRLDDDKIPFELFHGTNKTNSLHERIIWDCCWTYDSKYFMTVSRDKKALLSSIDRLEKLASRCKNSLEVMSSKDFANCLLVEHQFDSSIQAVDSVKCSWLSNSGQESGRIDYLFALGFECGLVELSTVSVNDDNQNGRVSLNQLLRLDELHYMPVRRLSFKPEFSKSQASTEIGDKKDDCYGTVTLASGADDCIVKLTRFMVVNI